MVNILPLLVAIPLGAAFLLPLLEKSAAGPRLSRILAVIISTALMALSLLFLTADNITYWMGGWTPDSGALGICLVLDNLSAFMLALVALVTLVATLFSLSYMKRYTAEPLYYCLFFLMVTGMNGVILAGDIFNLYVFLEVAAIASYSLVAFGCGSEELEASFKYLVLGTVGSVFILLGIAIVYNQTGQLNLAAIANALPQQNAALSMAAAFFLVGFSLKAAMVPFHAWLPDAHPSAPAPISAMLSGILIKVLGIYTLVRVFFTVLPINIQFTYILIVMGLLSMVIGVLLAIGQTDFKRLLGYSSISQMGYVILAVGIAAEMLLSDHASRTAIASLALFGGLFHLMNHAAFKSLLFLCSGAAEYATGTREILKLSGLKHRLPVTAGCLRIAALSISGVPPFNGFWSKLIIIIAVVQSGHYWLAALAVLVSFMTLITYLKVQRFIVDGDPSDLVEPAREVPFGMQLAMVILAIICIGAGILLPLYQTIFSDGAQSIITEQFTQLARLAGG